MKDTRSQRGARPQAQRGQTLLIFALAFVLIVGFAGLAIDGSHDYLVHRNSQNAADSAALAATTLMSKQTTQFTGAPTTSSGNTYLQAAHDLASTNGFPTVIGPTCDSYNASVDGHQQFTTSWVDTGACSGNTFNHRVTINIPPTPLTTSLAGDTWAGTCNTLPYNCVEVVITEHIRNYITGAIGAPLTTSTTNATAYAKQGIAGTAFSGAGFQAVYLYEKAGLTCTASQCFDPTKQATPRASLLCTTGTCPSFYTAAGSQGLITGIDGKTNAPGDTTALFTHGDIVTKGATTICDPYNKATCTAGSAVGVDGYAVSFGATIACSPQTGTALPVACLPGLQTGLKGLAGNETTPPSDISYSPVVTAPSILCGGLVLNGGPITASSFSGATDPSCIPTAADQFTILPGSYTYIVINHGRYILEDGVFEVTGTAPVTTRTTGIATDGIDHSAENVTDYDLCTSGNNTTCHGLTAGFWVGQGTLGYTAATVGTGGTCSSGVAVAGSQGGGGQQTELSGASVTIKFGPNSAGFVSTNEVTSVSLAAPSPGAQTGTKGDPVLFDMENNGVIHLDSSGATTDASGGKVSSSFKGLVYQTQSASAGGVEMDAALSGTAGLPAVTGQVLAYSLALFGGAGPAVDFSAGYGSGGGGVIVPKSKLEGALVPAGGLGVSYGVRAPKQPSNGSLQYPASGYEQFWLQYTDEWALDAYDTYVTINGGAPIFFSKGIWTPIPGSGDNLPPNGTISSGTVTNPDDQYPQRVDGTPKSGNASRAVNTGSYPTHVKTAQGDYDWIYKGSDSVLGNYYFETNGDWTWGHESDIGSTLNSPNTTEMDLTFPVPVGTTVTVQMYMTDGDHCGDYVTLNQIFNNVGGSGGTLPAPGGAQLMQ